jgi:hypothetical protein
MAYFVRNASHLQANKNWVFIERFAKIYLSKNISHNITFLYQSMFYIFEICGIVFTKTKRPKVGKLSLKSV